MRAKSAFIYVLCSIIAFTPTIGWTAYEFSAYEFSRNPARIDNSLRVQMSGRSALRSYHFVGRVGGVNFESNIDFTSERVDLDYDPTARDGSRAQLILNGQTYALPLFDWQLKPIANYADGQYTAAISIFGEGPDRENYYYIDYHPAFEDTHLGMRLLQADIMLMDPITFSEVPSKNGQEVYYPGEAREQPEGIRLISAMGIGMIMDQEPFQAWVLTDTDLRGSMRYENGVAHVDLTPYYYVWRVGNAGAQQRLVEEYNRLRTRVQPLIEQYQRAFATYERAPARSAEERTAFIEVQSLKARLKPDADRLEVLTAQLENFEPEIIEVTGLTQELRSSQELLDSLAPFVYDAVRKTAGYAALFRGVKNANPSGWDQFHNEVRSSIRLQPSETPNQFKKGGR